MTLLAPSMRISRLLTTAALTVAALSATATVTASAATTQLVRIGTAPALPAGTQPLASAAASQKLRVTVALAPRDAAGLTAYASAVADQYSPQYHRYLSTAQFAARFGASQATITRVETALKAAGLTPSGVRANHLSLDVVADAGSLERGFHIDLARVLLPSHRAALVNTQAPAVPAGIAPDVQAIVGLNGLATMRSNLARPGTAAGVTSTGAAGSASGTSSAPQATTSTTDLVSHAKKNQVPAPCAAASTAAGSQGAYTANQIAAAYRFGGLYDAGDEGAGVTVGVYELEPNSTADIAAYQACYGTSTSVSYQAVDGGAGTGDGSGEAAFDIEQLIGLAPKAKLIVYQAPNSNSDSPGSGPYDLFATMISQDQVQVISNSWGECEAIEGATDAHAENTLFEEAAVQGQTVLSASGDDGSEDCLTGGSTPSSALAVDDPGSQPFVTDVGGTSLSAAGPPPSETVWNSGGGGFSALGVSNGFGAGGGGISTFWAMPSYQSSAPASLNVINGYSTGTTCGNASGDCREVPDVSADADPAHGYLIYYNGDHGADAPVGWQATGGTSGAAPLWAAVIALTDADSECAKAPIGFANPALYRAAGADETGYFGDVTSGDNDFSNSHHGLYPATAGYDMASGLGSPSTTVLATELCAQTLRLSTATSGTGYRSLTKTSATGESSTTGQSFLRTPVKLAVRTSDAAGVTVNVAVTGLPAGVSYDATTHTISGTPTRTGVYAVKVIAGDSDSAVRSQSFTWRVAARPTVTHLSLHGLGAGGPVFSVRLSAGASESALSAATLTLPGGLTLARAGRVVVRSLSTGKALGRTVSGSGRGVKITLKSAATPVVVQFPAGALRASAGLSRSERVGRTAPTLKLTAVVKDAVGAVNTLHGSLKPST